MIVFIQNWHVYNKGERAVFSPAREHQLVESKVAKFVIPSTPQPVKRRGRPPKQSADTDIF